MLGIINKGVSAEVISKLYRLYVRYDYPALFTKKYERFRYARSGAEKSN